MKRKDLAICLQSISGVSKTVFSLHLYILKASISDTEILCSQTPVEKWDYRC